MKTYFSEHFAPDTSQVCRQCGSRYGQCEHTEAPAVVVPQVNGAKCGISPRYTVWTDEEEDLMVEMHLEGVSLMAIGNRLGRHAGSLSARLHKLGFRSKK